MTYKACSTRLAVYHFLAVASLTRQMISRTYVVDNIFNGTNGDDTFVRDYLVIITEGKNTDGAEIAIDATEKPCSWECPSTQ